ncbi:MOSC N-terminal beta barrel domain-containing protein [Bordetella holmesii]|uniref:MOSC N-terminal beta barrel domain protein n=2 Tax=Bordetella holmesii TaxID=35814 RepID=A0A158M0Y6_9BORD|nr:MOSC N-terminal beta barrel domain-containing protein [Bordetella holmesii]AHV92478.1 MOSC N-terminal beta barrel domain protein [Bordetella holmesii ATCC 51541]AIT25089.1 MOSC N-terminal beta barrel domain protein [Bordetella holmesii 44057]EWM45653.1 MOSC N-terminal beta barrel domain protein [Bordetella holmesii 70147]EWM48401.1 MOSC N-terminal beta barrel domain protein [Bordetella holmesii 41130]EWM49776.1 MOSC N-terminal beta barrel domain protein [Bordetella holmesii 35009]
MSVTYQPIADCGSTAQAEAQPYHRRWLVSNDAGQWLSRELAPRLAEINVDVRLGYLVLRAPGMLRLDIPLDVIEDDDSVRYQILIGGQTVDVVDEGELASAWMSNYLGIPARLLKVHPDMAAVRWPV